MKRPKNENILEVLYYILPTWLVRKYTADALLDMTEALYESVHKHIVELTHLCIVWMREYTYETLDKTIEHITQKQRWDADNKLHTASGLWICGECETVQYHRGNVCTHCKTDWSLGCGDNPDKHGCITPHCINADDCPFITCENCGKTTIDIVETFGQNLCDDCSQEKVSEGPDCMSHTNCSRCKHLSDPGDAPECLKYNISLEDVKETAFDEADIPVIPCETCKDYDGNGRTACSKTEDCSTYREWLTLGGLLRKSHYYRLDGKPYYRPIID